MSSRLTIYPSTAYVRAHVPVPLRENATQHNTTQDKAATTNKLGTCAYVYTSKYMHHVDIIIIASYYTRRCIRMRFDPLYGTFELWTRPRESGG